MCLALPVEISGVIGAVSAPATLSSGMSCALRRRLSAISATTFCSCTKRTGVTGCVMPARMLSGISMEYSRLTDRKRFVGERAVFSRQTLNNACFQADVRERSSLALVTVGGADAEGDTVKTAAFGKVVPDLLDLLVAPLGFDRLGCQWRQFRNRSAGCTNETADQ